MPQVDAVMMQHDIGNQQLCVLLHSPGRLIATGGMLLTSEKGRP